MLDFRSEPNTPAGDATRSHGVPRGYPLPRAVRRAIEFIHMNLSEAVHLDDIAGSVSLSTFHFAREFTKSTGVSPHRYLMRARIAKVKELLGKSELPLATIADEAGFTDQSHMSKVFKRLTGMTPKTFRGHEKLRTAHQLFGSLELLRAKVQRLRKFEVRSARKV